MEVFGDEPTTCVEPSRKRKCGPAPPRARKRKRALPKRRVYDRPFADIGAQMRRALVDPSGWDLMLHATFYQYLFGCDYVRREGWVKGLTAQTAWPQLVAARPRLVSVGGSGPYTVTIDYAATRRVLDDVIAGAGAKVVKVPTDAEWMGTLRRTQWTFDYMCNQWQYPEAVADPLQEVDGASVWGWTRVRGRVVETNAVSEEVPA